MNLEAKPDLLLILEEKYKILQLIGEFITYFQNQIKNTDPLPSGVLGTRIPAILDHENTTAKIESVKTLYPVLYDYSYFRKECFWEKQAKNIF